MATLTPEQMAVRATKLTGEYNPNKVASATPTSPVVPSTASTTPMNIGTNPISTKDLGAVSNGTNPTQTYTSTTGNLGMANNSAMGQIKTDAAYTPPVTDPRTEQKSTIQNLMAKISGQAAETNKITEDAGLFEKKQKATAISTELDVMDKAFRDRVKEIKENKEGKFGGAINQEIAQEEDRYQNNRANVALVYKVAVEDYNGAAEIVNSKVSALKDQNAQALQAYSMYADFLNNDLTESQKLQVQANLEQKQMEAKTKEDAYASYLSLAVQNKAPASVLAAIDEAARQPNATAATIAAVAGKYGIDPAAQLDLEYKRAQISKVNSEIAANNAANQTDTSGKLLLKQDDATKLNKELTSSDAYKALQKSKDSLQFLKSFEDTFNKTGATSAVFSPRDNAKLKAEYNTAILNLKEFFNLGVLNGPDEAILRGVLPDPTNRSAALTVGSLGIYNPASATRAGINNMKKQIETSLDEKFQSLTAQYGGYSSQSITSLNDLGRQYIEQKLVLNPDGFDITINGQTGHVNPDKTITIK